ncbi:hypothetical protein D9M68_17580 [compost metagenome]
MSTVIPDYPFDPTGTAETNLVVETQAIESRGTFDHYYVVPRVAPFFAESVKLRLYPIGANVNNPAGGQALEEGVHYNFGYHFAYASHTIGKPVYSSITFYDRTLRGQLRMEYQTLGGEWVLDDQKYSELLLNVAFNPRRATWEQVTELPREFPVVDHDFNIDDFVGMTEVVDELGDIEQAILQSNEGGLQDHVESTNNPHNVTKDQVGLGLVDNYPTAAPAEASGGIANNRFMTPLRTKQAIDALILPLLNAHMGDINNPHQTTKAQVGLGSVQNYAIATQAEAEAGSSNARYSTPLRVREAIEAIVGVTLNAHLADLSNPHQTTKVQVGLGNVQNIGIASDQAAILGADDSGVITPRLLSLVLAETIGGGVSEHIQDFGNPHGVTKTQVGLASVDNFPTATEAEARDATANNRFMTPLAVRQAINELVGDSSNAHVTDFENPHQVTAEQVGAYPTTVMDALLADKLGNNEPAADAEAVFGMDQSSLEDWIGTIKAGDSVRLDGLTRSELTVEILSGTAADTVLFGGKTYSEVVNEIGDTVDGASIQFRVPAMPELLDEFDVETQAPEHWIKLGDFRGSIEEQAADITLILAGGRDDDLGDDQVHGTVIVEIAATYDFTDGAPPFAMQLKRAVIKEIIPGTKPIEIGYRSVGLDGTAMVEVYLKSSGTRNSISVTELSYRRFNAAAQTAYTQLSQLTTVEPAGMVYPELLLEGTAQILELLDHAADTGNPHAVTKAQVGLGSVPDYPAASEAEALTGTATNRFMTPATTTSKVDDALGVLCDELIVVIDDALVNLFV